MPAVSKRIPCKNFSSDIFMIMFIWPLCIRKDAQPCLLAFRLVSYRPCFHVVSFWFKELSCLFLFGSFLNDKIIRKLLECNLWNKISFMVLSLYVSLCLESFCLIVMTFIKNLAYSLQHAFTSFEIYTWLLHVYLCFDSCKLYQCPNRLNVKSNWIDHLFH